MTRRQLWLELGSTAVAMLIAAGIARSLGALGVPVWVCWALFGVIFGARLLHGWITTQRLVPSPALPLAARLPLDAVTIGTLWGVWLR
ncbi:MAG TPA: hypothetical protein VGC72_06340 [Candidatus Elarobacter sp.]